MVSHPRPRWSYQRMLRALGAYLDRAEAGRFRLLEVPDGFEMVLEPTDGSPDLERVHFSYAALSEQAERLIRSRKLLGSKHRGGWSVSPTGRQDFLRALGYELDDSHARYVLLDELEGNLLVTYSYLDPALGTQWRKNMLVLGNDQVEAVIRAARDRRHRGGLLRR